MSFMHLWDGEVKALALACIPDDKQLLEFFDKPDDHIATPEEEKYLEEARKKYKDIYGIFYIRRMIGNIDHELLYHQYTPKAKYYANQIKTELEHPTYFKDFFGDDMEHPQRKAIAALLDGLRKLTSAND